MSLPEESLALVAVAAALAAGDRARLRRALEEADRVCSPRAVEEALLQSYLFLGYPAALNGLELWRDVSGRSATDAVENDRADWAGRGLEICGRVYGDQLDPLRENIRRLHPEMETWMLTEGYGKVLGRPGLSLADRELGIVALLARSGPGVARQLHSHLRGALRVGVGEEEVQGALERALDGAPEPVARSAREVWDTVRTRSLGNEES